MIYYIERVKEIRLYNILYWFLKITLGLTFISSGIRKLPNIKFTELPISNPVGLFFEGMHSSGFYWNFIGYYQIFFGILLMTKWYAKLTPLLILPVTFNIFLVSISLHMKGTPIITSFMLLGNIYLVLWHIKSYALILKK